MYDLEALIEAAISATLALIGFVYLFWYTIRDRHHTHRGLHS